MPTQTPALNKASHFSQLISINNPNTQSAGNKKGLNLLIVNLFTDGNAYFKPNFNYRKTF